MSGKESFPTSMTSNWSEALPSDLVRSIAERLPFEDCIRLRAVCKPWTSALRGFRSSVPSDFPWLAPTKAILTNKFPFFIPQEDRFYYLKSPHKKSFRVVGSRDGWLVTLDKSNDAHIVNPITGEQINLPAIHGSIKKVVLSSNPSAPGSHVIAVVVYVEFDRMAFARVGDKAWATFRAHFLVHDAVCQGSTVFAIGHEGQLQTFNLSRLNPMPSLILRAPDHRGARTEVCYCCLVLSPSGDVLLVGQKRRRYRRIRRYFILMLQSDAASSSRRWLVIKDLGDQALFLGCGHAMSVPTTNNSALRRNCIYFVNDSDDPCTYGEEFTGLVGLFDIEKRVFETCYTCMGYSKLFWFVPSLF